MAYASDKAYMAASEFVFASPHIQPHADFAAYAMPSFTKGADLALAAQDLMQRMHRDFTYASQSTEINTPALQALHQRRGVCQDFAHIFIACLRSLGLPARYVSGYLLTQPPPGKPRLIGSDASHAWASVHLLDAHGEPMGWLDLDPTNNRSGLGTPGEDYVTLAWGRDYADISPMRGVIQGGNSHQLKVAVTVMPTSEHQAKPQ
jgi:transglutaminase-like putative cysteine protease